MRSRWTEPFFLTLTMGAQLLVKYIDDNKDRDGFVDTDMKIYRQVLKPLTDAEIKAVFKEIEPIREVTPDKKKMRLLAYNGAIFERQVKRFVPPTLEEAEIYFIENGSTKAVAKKFFNFYESKAWKVGKSPMVKWRAAASNFLDDNQPKKQETEKNYIII